VSALVDEVAELIRDILDLGEPATPITPQLRLEGDLRLESVDLLALGEALRDRYGDRIDFCAHVAELDLDGIIGLTVGDVAAYVEVSR
jgi:acyl carrier protein